MHDNVTDLPTPEVPDVIGAKRSGYSVFLQDDGEKLLVPHMRCYQEENGDITFGLASHVFTFPKEWSYLAAAFATQAMAVQAGATYYTKDVNGRPFCQRVAALSEIPNE